MILLDIAAGVAQPRAQLDAWTLMTEASLTVKGVLIILAMMSLGSWFIIGAKWIQLGRVARESQRFLKLFWGAEQSLSWNNKHLDDVYNKLYAVAASPLARIFKAGYHELNKVSEANRTAESSPNEIIRFENIERSLKRTSVVELARIESMVSWLATTGSTAPFIGLFGTVWGIMYAITALHQQSLPVVSQQIAEALIATAIGLAAAIPAVMAYNFFLNKIRILEGEIDAFANDYLNIIHHYLSNK